MIRIQKLKATRYYVDMEEQYTQPKDYADYLSKNSHISAQFVGDYFNLEYSRERYDTLIKGKDPATYKNLTRENKNSGYDIVIAMPKSYSMLYAAADSETREKLNQIQQEVVKRYLEDAAKYIRPAGSRNEYSEFDPNKTKNAAAEFWHIENRDIEPHVHAHINIFNFAEFTMNNGDKKTFAINAQELYYRQKEMSGELNNRLCDQLQEIGFKTVGTKDGFRVVGITEEQEKIFSGRRSDILDFIEEQKRQGKYFSSRTEAEKAEENIRNETKEQKSNLNSREILDHQKTQLAAKGITRETILEHQKNYEYNPPEIIEQAIIRDATALAGVVSETELRRQILDSTRDLQPDQRINFEDFCRRNELIEMNLGNGHKGYTTNEIIITEMQNIEQAKALAAGEYGKLHLNEQTEEIKIETLNKIKTEIIEKTNGKAKLNEGQEQACELIAKNERICLIEGDAGTGKTTTAIKFANDYYASQGYEIVGLATQGKTSQSLQDAGIENCQNLSQFFIKEPSGANRVLVVDEAGMTGAEQYRQLLRYAQENDNTKLIFVGDQKQLASVAYGTTFENIRKHLGEDHQRRLWENTRQKVYGQNGELDVVKTEQQKSIAAAARDKQPGKLLETLEKTGGLHENATREQAIQQLARDYATSEKTKVALAYTSEDVNRINDAIRQEIAAQSKLDMSRQTEFIVKTGKITESRYFAEGDQIILTGKYKKTEMEDIGGQAHKTKVTIENGTEAVIKKIDGNKLTIEAKEDNREYTIDTQKFRQFNHAYCITTHKSQGMTVEESYVYANGNETANRNYVNMSRHKEAANLYITAENKERYIESVARAEDKANITKDAACQERYQYLKENRHNLLADPYDTRNQIADLKQQINRNEHNQDLQQRLDQMHRLDTILDNLQKKHNNLTEQITAYEEWKSARAANRGQWQKQPVKDNTYIQEIKEKEKIVETQIRTAQDILDKLKQDIKQLQEEKYTRVSDKTREEILAELKEKPKQQVPDHSQEKQKKLADIKRQIALNELAEIKQGRHIMTPIEALRRETQISQLAKIKSKEAEQIMERLSNEITTGTRSTQIEEKEQAQTQTRGGR